MISWAFLFPASGSYRHQEAGLSSLFAWFGVWYLVDARE